MISNEIFGGYRMKIVIGSRGSKLALKQSDEVKKALEKLDSHIDVRIQVIHTKGDQILDKPLNQIGDKGLFTTEIEKQLLEKKIDIAVHSMKDMPSFLPAELMFAGTIVPQDHRDCLVFNGKYHSIDDLPQGSVIGTGSPRRKYQLLNYRQDLKIVGIRGNVETRLKKMEEQNMDALVLASAGLKRLGLEHLIGQYFDESVMVPACAQGILAIEIRKDSPVLPLIQKIEDPITTQRMRLERLFLETIQGSCHEPIGVYVSFINNGLQFHAVYGDQKGKKMVTRHELIEKDYEKRIVDIALMMKEQVKNNG